MYSRIRPFIFIGFIAGLHLVTCEKQSHGSCTRDAQENGLCKENDESDSEAVIVRQTLHETVSELNTLYEKLLHEQHRDDFLLVTVATNETDGFKRFMRSAKTYNIPVKVLGLGQKWEGGDLSRFSGGGQKVSLLKEELQKHKDQTKKVIMFTDSYDVILLAGVDRMLSQFEKMAARILFSAEGYCWPDESLAVQYPPVQRGKRFLNSGGFMGYAPAMNQLVSSWNGAATDDDQLFYTHQYLNDDTRAALKIKLDHKSEVFQNLNGAVGDVELEFGEDGAVLHNIAYKTQPMVVHGNGPRKQTLNSLGNYLAKAWNPNNGCTICEDDLMSLPKKDGTWPSVLLSVFIEQATPFLEEFLNKIVHQDYPKTAIHLFIHNAAEYHIEQINTFIEEKKSSYASVTIIQPSESVSETSARNQAIKHCRSIECDFLFVVDAVSHLDNKNTLQFLMKQNRPVIAPLLTRPYKAWSNFWGALNSEGFYARAADYMQIVKGERRGVWNVPYVSSCYLVRGSILQDEATRPSYTSSKLDPDMAFCGALRTNDVFMFVTNLEDFGHLVNPDNFETTHLHNELYQIFDNRWDFEQRYIHENYSQGLNPNNTVQQPCPDVYWFPIITDRYCKELIEEMENFGKWSDGSNKDPRLDGGYENVPTRDIHMKQVGMEQHWLEFLGQYVRPLQEKVFLGYIHDDDRIEGGYENVPTRDIHMTQIGMEKAWDYFLAEFVRPLQKAVFLGYSQPPRALMNFVVRYRPDEQPFLRPHHDSSTYTINIALNTPKVDYEGGGCRFVRYNCSVKDTRRGWMLMHPGRLTHYHEGLQVTRGTRYIMISFVDP